jgi:hypothetical protein
MRRRKSQPWYSDIPARLRFEGQARSLHPTLRSTRVGHGHDTQIIYRLTIDVPEYEPRNVQINLSNWHDPYANSITADGPTDSPHRYGRTRLCIWRPGDPPERTWVAGDGLVELIAQIRIHLFKEAYWRETGEWLGPEAPHAPLSDREMVAA